MIPHPMNWWVVANHLKHGMTTVRPAGMPAQRRGRRAPHAAHRHRAAMEPESVRRPLVPAMVLLSFAALAGGLAIAYSLGPGEGSREGR